MMTVYLHGGLKRFGRRFDLHVADAAEAVRALCSQLSGFRMALQNGNFKLRYGNRPILPEKVETALHESGHASLHITPVVTGAGGRNGGLVQVIAGVVLLVVAWYAPPAWGLSASMIAGIGAFGASLVIGGVAQLLTKVPQNVEKESKSLQSSSFGGAQNLAANGQPIPLVYGEMLVGSLVVSQGITSYSIQSGGSIGFTPAGKASTTPNWIKREEDSIRTVIYPDRDNLLTLGVAGTFKEPIQRTKTLIKKLF